LNTAHDINIKIRHIKCIQLDTKELECNRIRHYNYK